MQNGSVFCLRALFHRNRKYLIIYYIVNNRRFLDVILFSKAALCALEERKTAKATNPVSIK